MATASPTPAPATTTTTLADKILDLVKTQGVATVILFMLIGYGAPRLERFLSNQEAALDTLVTMTANQDKILADVAIAERAQTEQLADSKRTRERFATFIAEVAKAHEQMLDAVTKRRLLGNTSVTKE